jgi:hypothetical protein
MTKEQLREKLDNICCQLKKIDYEELHKVYATFNWQWGGYEEPKFIPEYRDLKRLVLSLFDEIAPNLLYDFEEGVKKTINEEIERDNICLELTYDEYEDDVKAFVSVKKLTSVISGDGAENFQVNGDDKS